MQDITNFYKEEKIFSKEEKENPFVENHMNL